MTHMVSRDDVENTIWRTGIKDPRKTAELLRIIDLYAYSLSRKAVPVDDVPMPDGRTGNGPRFLCRGPCGERLPITAFPTAKLEDRSHPYDCIACGGADRKEYLCVSCNQKKTIGQFPEARQKNPRLRSFCTYCEDRRITAKDAGYSRNR